MSYMYSNNLARVAILSHCEQMKDDMNFIESLSTWSKPKEHGWDRTD